MSLVPPVADHRAATLPIEEAPGPTFERTRQIHERRPPIDLVMSLTSLFFRHIHPWFPFLDIQRVCIEMSASDDPTLLHYALFGVSLPYSFDSRLDQKSSDSFWKYSKRQILLEALEEPSFNALEALTVLILDLSGMTTGPQVWGALAIAAALLVQLRNGGSRVFRASVVDSDSNSVNRVDRLHRQKLFWAVYTLDCYISITTCRPSYLTDDQVESVFHTRELIWRKSTTGMQAGMGLTPNFVCSYQLELLDISRKLHTLHLEYASISQNSDSILRWLDRFQKCSAELFNWAQTLPTCLQLFNRSHCKQGATTLDLPSIVALQAYYHALVIHIHSLLNDPTCEFLLSQPINDIRRDSQDRCLHSVHVLVEIASGWTAKTGDKLGWPFVWSLWTGARYLLVQESRGDNSQSEKFSNLLDALLKMSRYWQISGKYFRLLKEAATELRTGDQSNARSDQGILRFLTDFRVATSDLEDQSRVDPMMQYESTGEGPIQMPNASRYASAPDRQDPQQMGPDDNYFNLPYQASDNWFHVPLFASSAYQQDYTISSETW
ncbi:hypothetical protein F1880_001324 [Penicillium rolfsii]|nr:hypothetical protein F1880_001324 [Penicillium rolfsii]